MESNESTAGDLDLGGGEAEAPADPFASVPADVPEPGEEPAAPAAVPAEGALGGEGATLDELEEAPAEEPINGDDDPEPLPGNTEPEPASEEPTAEPAPEPEAAAKAKTKKEGTAERPYIVLVEQEDGTWDKATAEPIVASNGEVALRQAYAELVPADKEDSKTLVVIPVHYWKPKTVSAKAKVSRAVEIA